MNETTVPTPERAGPRRRLNPGFAVLILGIPLGGLVILWSVGWTMACVEGASIDLANQMSLEHGININPSDIRRQMLGGREDRTWLTIVYVLLGLEAAALLTYVLSKR